MKVRLPIWSDDRGEVIKKEFEIEPIAYRSGPKAYWKLLIADEDLTIYKNKIYFIKIKKISLESNTIISPLSSMVNEFGVVLEVYGKIPVKIEEKKEIDMVAFYPIKDGQIKKGDLLGVLNVFGVNIGPINQMTKLDSPKIEMKSEEVEANVVFGGKRKKTKIKEYSYRKRSIAEWIPLVADEDMDVKAGEPTVIRVEKTQLSPQTIPIPLSIMRHPLGSVVSVASAKLEKIENPRTIDKAVFIPCSDGRIEKGDLIGILSNYHISIGDMPSEIVLLGSQKANIVYESGGKIIRKECELKPFGYKESNFGILEPIVAAEDMKIKPGNVVKIRIEEINLPASTLAQPLLGRNNALGILLDVTTSRPALVEEDRKLVAAVFIPTSEGYVKKGDLIGVLNIYHVAVMTPSQLISFKLF